MRASFWINAFIPAFVPEYSQSITTGVHAGKTAIPLPGLARANPFNMLKNWNVGYLTDQRSFSNKIDSSVRMRSLVEVEISRDSIYLVRAIHETSGTTEVDIESGEQLGFKPADLSRCWWRPTVRPVQVGRVHIPFVPGTEPFMMPGRGGSTTFDMQLLGQAADPLVSAAADIDYEGVVSFSVSAQSGNLLSVAVEFDGKIDAFPAFEAYASFAGRILPIFNAPPPRGNTVMNLPGRANRPIFGVAQF